MKHTRRQILAGLAAIGASCPPAVVAQGRPVMTVAKDPNCGCCAQWIGILESEGFDMDVRNLDYDALQDLKARAGIPGHMASCHTAFVDGYVIEGHVPPADIRRLLAERPAALGLSVPGMPIGSPGMGPETDRDAYAVHLMHTSGRTQVFETYDARP